jgi:hypothetical protein
MRTPRDGGTRRRIAFWVVAAVALLVAALVATQAWFPDHYWDYVRELDRAWLVLLRNVLLVALVAVLSLPRRARARPRTT